MSKPEKLKYDHYGLPIYKLPDGTEWAHASSDAAADRAAKEYILGSVWAFRSKFLLDHMPKGMTIEAIEAIQAQSEDANEPLLALIKNKAKFVKEAISADGRGHFLSHYNGEEETPDRVDGLESLRKGYVYRVN